MAFVPTPKFQLLRDKSKTADLKLNPRVHTDTCQPNF